MILLDTHVLLWLISGDSNLGNKTKRLIDSAYQKNQVAISAISFWEISLLKQKSRIDFNEDVSSFRKELLHQGVSEIAINGEVGVYSTQLDNFHADPADRFIVASALIFKSKLVTADRKILDWKNGLSSMDART